MKTTTKGGVPLRPHFLIALMALLLAACASPQARIRKNPEVFEAFPPEVQEKVRRGEIAIGYTRDMVHIALGRPDRVYSRETAEGSVEIWSFVDHEIRPERQLVDGSFRVHVPGAGYRTVRDTVWINVDRRYEYDRLRLEIRDHRVHAIERLER